MKTFKIIAPHADDEIIGCFEILSSGLVRSVIFPDYKISEEAEASSKYFLFAKTVIHDEDFFREHDVIYLFPDPYFEAHPKHRELGSFGEGLLRQHRQVVFYSTNMSAPYIHEVSEADTKQKCLTNLYPTKHSLWEYEHKYFLFEGYSKWITKWEDLL